jgi:integrase
MPHVERRVQAGTLRWRARYRGPDGRERSRSFARKTDAEQFLAQVETDKAHGSWVDPALGEVRLDEWAPRWLSTTVHLKPKTRADYESLLRVRILPTFGKAPIAAIRPIDVREWLARMQAEGLSASRCRQACHLLGAILQTAVADGRIPSSPCTGMKLPRLPQVEMAYLSPGQLSDLLNVLPAKYRLMVEVLAIAGLRFGEAAALRKARCDLLRNRLVIAENLSDVSGKLYFVAPKTHQRRMVSIPRSLSERLARTLIQVTAPEDLVFTSARGAPIRYSNFLGRVWKPSLVEAGLPDMGVHALRHTCAALLISQGAHPKAIQRHLGHQSITTTLDRYGHLFEDEDGKLVQGLDDVYTRVIGGPAADGFHLERRPLRAPAG